MMSEMLAKTILEQRMKGSPARGLAWEVMVDSLNEIHSPKFQLKDKKAVRERWSLHLKKIQQKDERGKEVGFLWKSYGETIIDRGVI